MRDLATGFGATTCSALDWVNAATPSMCLTHSDMMTTGYSLLFTAGLAALCLLFVREA